MNHYQHQSTPKKKPKKQPFHSRLSLPVHLLPVNLLCCNFFCLKFHCASSVFSFTHNKQAVVEIHPVNIKFTR